MSEMNLPNCFDLLRTATTAKDDGNSAGSPSTDPFETLCNRLEGAVSGKPEILQILNTLPTLEDSVPGRYVRLLAACLKKLAELLSLQSSDFLISVQQRTLISSALEFLVAIGILPCLDVGVGLPLEKRSSLVKSWTRITEETKRRNQLKLCVDCLMDLVNSHESIKSIIVTKFLGDFVAANEQLKVLKLLEVEEKFEKILEEVFRPTLIRELLMLSSGRGGIQPPLWLREICGGRLSKLLVEQNGLFCLTQAVDDFGGVEFWSDWRKIDSIARIVSCRPKNFPGSSYDYYTNISDQVINLLDVNTEKFGPFCALVILKMHKISPKVIDVQIFDRLLRPIERIAFSLQLNEFMDCTNLEWAIKCCAKIFILPPGETIPNAPRVLRMAPVLLGIFADVQESISPLKTDLKELLAAVIYRSGIDPDRQAKVLIDALLNTTFDGLLFMLNETLTMNKAPPLPPADMSDIFEKKTSALLSVLDSFPLDSRGEVISKMISRCLSALKVDDVTEDRMKQMLLLSMLLERFQDQFMSNWAEMLVVVKEVLEASQCAMEGRLLTDETNERTIELVLAILGAALISADVSEREKFAVFAPLLSGLQSHPKASIQDSAKSLLQIFTDYLNIDTASVQTADNATSSRKSKQHACLTEVLRDLDDPLEAVKGHALIEISRRVRTRDPEFLNQIEQLLPAVLAHLSDNDSYVFLAAVGALAELTLFQPDKHLPILVDLFTDWSSQQRPLTLRANVGEVLARVCRQLGPIASFHTDKLVNAFLSLVKESDEMLRASALSSLADLCIVSTRKIMSSLQELLYCVNQLLTFEKSPLVRRAAVNLVRSILAGSKEDMLSTIRDSLLDIYRLLKRLRSEDSDEIVRIHAELCLEEIRTNMNDAFDIEKRSLIREIRMQ